MSRPMHKREQYMQKLKDRMCRYKNGYQTVTYCSDYDTEKCPMTCGYSIKRKALEERAMDDVMGGQNELDR